MNLILPDVAWAEALGRAMEVLRKSSTRGYRCVQCSENSCDAGVHPACASERRCQAKDNNTLIGKKKNKQILSGRQASSDFKLLLSRIPGTSLPGRPAAASGGVEVADIPSWRRRCGRRRLPTRAREVFWGRQDEETMRARLP